CGCNEEDKDEDGVCDLLDECPDNPLISESGICGCDDKDSDGDGVCDSIDECPDNPVKSASGICGCDENDSDRDGICDEQDVCDVSGSNRFEWIESISINSFNNKSGPNDNGYGFYGQDAITISAGGLLKVWINVGHTDAICELSHVIFIDWNKDTDFKDQGEMIFNERNTGETGIDYQLSEEIQPGKYVMRVMVDLGRIYGACGGCIDGESEDYVINIADNSCINAYEGFDYDKDVDFSNQSGGKSWSEGWNVIVEGDVKAKVISSSIQNALYESNGNKLGVLNAPGSKLKISRNLSDEVFKKDGDVWLSFTYKYDDDGIFVPQINGGSIGFYVDSKGYVVIGGLKGQKLSSGDSYTFLVRATLNIGVDEITLWINPSDIGSEFSQNYNTSIDGHLASIGFDFKNSGSNDRKTAQYLDEIRVACSRDEVLPKSGSDLDRITSDEDENRENLKVYPNPMQKGAAVVVSLNGATVLVHEFKIYDASGRMMHSGVFYTGENELHQPELESGIYFIELKTENGMLRERLVIQNQ
ncbi:MAG: T9SS type A sorting domain-containing protein, partial [Saprospiraceae bacterium]|nr:T9SS type A sorting domain-containing protein [Saprospiraceae bacterium]